MPLRTSVPLRTSAVPAPLRAAAVPLLTCLVTLGALTAWTTAGQAGSPAEITVTDGRVLVPTNPEANAAFFTLRNTGGSDDQLTGVTGPAGRSTMLSRDVEVGPNAHSMAMVSAATVPAGGELRMSPSTLDVMMSPPPPLSPGDRLTFTFHFRHSPPITARAVAVRPGE